MLKRNTSGVMIMGRKPYCCNLFMFSISLLSILISAKKHGNAANDLVDVINQNRTAQKLSRLTNSPGLGCMALQYIEECKGTCSSNNSVNCQIPEDDFTEIFAPNCGVELPTFGTLSGRIIGCQSKYVEPSQAYSHILVRDKKILTMVKDKNHTEVGVGMIGTHRGPFFWCVLFSNDKINSTFVLEGEGRGIKQKKGCFSGANTPCSRQQPIHEFLNTTMTLIFLVIVCCITFL